MSRLSSSCHESNIFGVQCLGGALDSLPQLAGDGLFHAEKGHDVDEIADIETVQEVIELDSFRDICRQAVEAADSAGRISPLRQTDDGVRLALWRQHEIHECGRGILLQMMGVVRDEEPDQKLLECWRFLVITEVR